MFAHFTTYNSIHNILKIIKYSLENDVFSIGVSKCEQKYASLFWKFNDLALEKFWKYF